MKIYFALFENNSWLFRKIAYNIYIVYTLQGYIYNRIEKISSKDNLKNNAKIAFKIWARRASIKIFLKISSYGNKARMGYIFAIFLELSKEYGLDRKYAIKS